MSLPANRELLAIGGDLLHKSDVYCYFQSVSNSSALQLITNRSQADWLRKRYPELVPPNNGPNPPNDHSVGTAFEANYTTVSALRRSYLLDLYNGRLT
ncbi:hypothetical protein [Erysiphe necator associated deltaflexivirus 3]|nr:hypothetical protein [Erysiphe necator associated deltaflexivirus 3]